MTQRFKENDPNEAVVNDLAMPTLNALGEVRDQFEAGAFECFKLGEVLFDLQRDPTAGVITREVFRSSFFAIHSLFTRPGTFEFYLEMFRAIFGDDASIDFTVPAPGKLEIGVTALDLVTFNLLARSIVDGVYEYYPLKTSDTGDNIVGQGSEGLRTQAEIDALIAEVSPSGIYTTCTLAE